MDLPRQSQNNQPYVYYFEREVTHKQMDEKATLSELGVQEGEILKLTREEVIPSQEEEQIQTGWDKLIAMTWILVAIFIIINLVYFVKWYGLKTAVITDSQAINAEQAIPSPGNVQMYQKIIELQNISSTGFRCVGREVAIKVFQAETLPPRQERWLIIDSPFDTSHDIWLWQSPQDGDLRVAQNLQLVIHFQRLVDEREQVYWPGLTLQQADGQIDLDASYNMEGFNNIFIRVSSIRPDKYEVYGEIARACALYRFSSDYDR
jgi:hypothetical protein